MAVTCDANTLSLSSGCFQGISAQLQQAIRIRLLCGYINGETMTCDVNTLSIAATCYLGLSADQSEAVQTYLVCQLAAGSSGGVSGNFSGVVSPEGSQTGSPGNTYVDTVLNKFWVKTSGISTNTGWTQFV